MEKTILSVTENSIIVQETIPATAEKKITNNISINFLNQQKNQLTNQIKPLQDKLDEINNLLKQATPMIASLKATENNKIVEVKK